MRRVPTTPTLSLYPLLVVLLALALFYLPMWSATGECSCGWIDGPHRVRIPIAHETTPIDDPAPIVEIRRDTILLDGRDLGLPQCGLVVALRDQLTTLRNNYALLHPHDGVPDTYYLVAAGTTPSWVLAAVRHSAVAAGYNRPWYVVEADVPHDEYPYPFW